jgi:SAM-dependent methyltransferase
VDRFSPLVEVMAKHLPPSASRLRLLDVGGRAAATFAARRDDLDIRTLDRLPADTPDDSADSITFMGDTDVLPASFLTDALRVLRPGGRLIMADPNGKAGKAWVAKLEAAGHTRILVEAVEPEGVLLRGEKPHTTSSTFARVRVAADADADDLMLATFDGPYVFVLVQQTPNKPVWKLGPDEVIEWNAVVVVAGDTQRLVAFTSLPKAVSLMQPAVVQGVIQDVNKVGKFSRETATGWLYPVLLNPTLDALKRQTITLVPLDPATAEAPDE